MSLDYYDSQSKTLGKQLNKWVLDVSEQERRNAQNNVNNGRLTPIQKAKFRRILSKIKKKVLEVQRIFKEKINDLIDSYDCQISKYTKSEDIPPIIEMKDHIKLKILMI